MKINQLIIIVKKITRDLRSTKDSKRDRKSFYKFTYKDESKIHLTIQWRVIGVASIKMSP